MSYAYLPSGEAGAKMGLDDWLAAGNDIATLPRLARPDPLPPPGTPTPDVPVRPDVPTQDGAELLDAVENTLRYFTVMPCPEAYIAVALWIVHTHFIDFLDCSPRLLLTSAQKQSGKTRVMEVAEQLCRNALRESSASAAYTFRRIEQGPISLFIDECDAIFASGREYQDLRSVLNAGFARGATVGRCDPVTLEPREYATFAPVMLAGIGDCVPETVRDRAIVIRMRRRLPGERVQRLYRRVWADQAPELRDRIAAWAYDDGPNLRESYPTPLPDLSDRAWDGWEPLVAIADLAGGPWPDRARNAAQKLHAAQIAAGTGDNEDTVSLRALAACRQVFTTPNPLTGQVCGPLTPTQLVGALNALPDAEWRDMRRGEGLSANQLGRWLRQYEIEPPPPQRNAGQVHRTYEAKLFADAWKRYLSDERDGDQ